MDSSSFSSQIFTPVANSIPPSSQTPSSNSSPLVVFSHSLTTKLDDKNYLPWHQQTTSVVQGHGLDDFLFKNSMLDKFLAVEDRLADRINPALVLWQK